MGLLGVFVDEVMVSGSLMDTIKSAEIRTVYEEPWEQFVAHMREAHERILGPTLEDKERNSALLGRRVSGWSMDIQDDGEDRLIS